MAALPHDEIAWVIHELIDMADEFAARAREQEACRDRVRPGTGRHHHHAHSATLWRSAERVLRARVLELDPHATPSEPRVPAQPWLIRAQSTDPL